MPTGYPKVWTEEMYDRLRRLYPTTLNIDLMRMFGISWKTLNRKAKQMGLTKADNYADIFKRERYRRQCIAEKNKTNCPTRFKKGEHNGLATEFKKGPMSNEDKEKHRQAMNKVMYAERVRIKYGLPQKTRIKFNKKYDLNDYLNK